MTTQRRQPHAPSEQVTEARATTQHAKSELDGRASSPGASGTGDVAEEMPASAARSVWVVA
jgi:hypothetical protein